MAWLLRKLIRGYQLLLSPLLGSRCRFYPSCSAYALQAIELHGAFKGSWLAIKRLGRCHPYHPGGLDYVPGSPEALAEQRSQCCKENHDD